MTTSRTRSQSPTTSEAAVRSLRVMMTGYQLWGTRSETAIDSLASILSLPAGELAGVIGELVAEGWVDRHGENVSLTPAGVEALELAPPTRMM